MQAIYGTTYGTAQGIYVWTWVEMALGGFQTSICLSYA